jgi:hypothetical protein
MRKKEKNGRRAFRQRRRKLNFNRYILIKLPEGCNPELINVAANEKRNEKIHLSPRLLYSVRPQRTESKPDHPFPKQQIGGDLFSC